MITLRTITPDDWRAWRELRLEAPYAYGATLAQWQGEGDTEERRRLESVTLNHRLS